MTKLLNIDANAKTIKGQKKGYMTAVMYLAPYKTSGINVCPFAEKAGCWQTCLNTAGRGGISKSTFEANGITLPDNAIQRARIWRTQFWANHRTEFLAQLVKEIEAFIKKAERKGLTPVVRLNGTSDIQWEKVKIPRYRNDIGPKANMMERFPNIQFYDYTKIPKRLATKLPSNYYLCLSYSAADAKYEKACTTAIINGASAVYVARDQKTKDRLLERFHEPVDGDEHDLRFLDPPQAAVVLKAKGSAKHETNGFVLG